MPINWILGHKPQQYGYLYCENGGLKRLLDDMKFVPNLNIIVENLSFFFLMFLEPYMRV